MRKVERDHRDRRAAVEHHRRGKRVGMHVELGGRRRIAERIGRAAHHHQPGHQSGNLGRLDERRRDVGQRSQSADRHAPGLGRAQRLDQEIDPMLRL